MSKWEWKEFEDCIERVKYTTKIPSKDYLQEGEFPIVSQEDCLISGYWNDRSDLFKVTKPIVIFGDHTKVLKYIDFDFVLGADGVKILCPKDYLNAHFFFYFLKSVNFDNLGYARHYRLLKELSVPIPPLSEQKRIVKFLDEEFSKIETLKTNAETNLKNAKELFETTLEKELNPQSRNSERSEESSADLPSGWEWKTLQEISNVYGEYGLSVPSTSYNGIRYLRITDITDDGRLNDEYVSADIEKIEESDKLQEGDILFARTGATVGKTLIFKENYGCCVFAGYLIRYRPKKEVVLPFYLHYVTHSKYYFDWVKKSQKAAAQPNISAKLYNAFQIPLPPLSVQKEIVARLDKLSENVKRLEANYKHIIADCDELKKSILKKTFEGDSRSSRE